MSLNKSEMAEFNKLAIKEVLDTITIKELVCLEFLQNKQRVKPKALNGLKKKLKRRLNAKADRLMAKLERLLNNPL